MGMDNLEAADEQGKAGLGQAEQPKNAMHDNAINAQTHIYTELNEMGNDFHGTDFNPINRNARLRAHTQTAHEHVNCLF